MTRKLFSLALTLVLLLTLAVGGISTASAEEKLLIGISLDTVDSDFWVSTISYFESTAAELGVDCVIRFCEGDANRQNQQIEDLIAQGADAIICGANDGATIVAAVKKCNDAGIPIVMCSRSVMGDEGVPQAQLLVDNITLAQGSIEYLAEKAQASGATYKAALLIGGLGDQNALERRDGHKAILEKYPEIFEIVAEIPTDWKAEQAYAGLQNAFEKDSDINLVITPSDTFFTTIQSVLEPLGKWVTRDDENHVTVVGFDGDAIFAEMMETGYVDVGAVNDTRFMGGECMNWAVKLAKGEPAPAEMNILDPGIICTPDNWDDTKAGVWGYEAFIAK